MDVMAVEGYALIRILLLPQVTVNVTKKWHKSTLFLPVYGLVTILVTMSTIKMTKSN